MNNHHWSVLFIIPFLYLNFHIYGGEPRSPDYCVAIIIPDKTETFVALKFEFSDTDSVTNWEYHIREYDDIDIIPGEFPRIQQAVYVKKSISVFIELIISFLCVYYLIVFITIRWKNNLSLNSKDKVALFLIAPIFMLFFALIIYMHFFRNGNLRYIDYISCDNSSTLLMMQDKQKKAPIYSRQYIFNGKDISLYNIFEKVIDNDYFLCDTEVIYYGTIELEDLTSIHTDYAVLALFSCDSIPAIEGIPAVEKGDFLFNGHFRPENNDRKPLDLLYGPFSLFKIPHSFKLHKKEIKINDIKEDNLSVFSDQSIFMPLAERNDHFGLYFFTTWILISVIVSIIFSIKYFHDVKLGILLGIAHLMLLPGIYFFILYYLDDRAYESVNNKDTVSFFSSITFVYFILMLLFVFYTNLNYLDI